MFGRKKKKKTEQIDENTDVETKKETVQKPIEKVVQNDNKDGNKEKELSNTEKKSVPTKEKKPTSQKVEKESKSDEKIVIRRNRKVDKKPKTDEYVEKAPKRYKELVIRETKENIQASILEDGRLVEHVVSIAENKSIVGDIYYGKVQEIYPAADQAFIDIGSGNNAVIFSSDINGQKMDKNMETQKISDLLKVGDNVLVQAKKDPMRHKGARLTTRIALQGEYVVYLPESEKPNGAFKKLSTQKRDHIREIFKTVIPDGNSAIAREACNYADDDEIINDIANLISEWNEIKNALKKAKPPVCIKEEPNVGVKIMRDTLIKDYEKIIVSGDNEYKLAKEYIRKNVPTAVDKVEKWDNSTDIFAVKKIDEQIAKALNQTVYLPSGGSIVFDKTEAMTVVDVNTGSNKGDKKTDSHETRAANNLEAAEELVNQIRLRDIGGIIAVDFIDMEERQNQNKVLDKLITCLKEDRTHFQVSEFTKIGGLVIMTRKKIGIGLMESFSKRCEECEGRGYILTTKPVKEIDTAGADFTQNAGKKHQKSKPKKDVKVIDGDEEKKRENAEIMKAIHKKSKG